MKIIRYIISKICLRRSLQLVVGIAFCVLTPRAPAATVMVGALSYDTFIPGGIGSPGVYAFDVANLTGVFSLPSDFPVIDALTFGSATLTLTLSDLSQSVIILGEIGPGFLLDQSGNPIVQVAGDQIFESAEFTATLSPLTFSLSDGSSFTSGSTLIDVLLLPSSGPTLTVDVDQTVIGLSETAPITTPEPASRNSLLLAMSGLAWLKYRRPAWWAKSREQI